MTNEYIIYASLWWLSGVIGEYSDYKKGRAKGLTIRKCVGYPLLSIFGAVILVTALGSSEFVVVRYK